jgi:polysaccharide biosynthesis/export protein
MMTNTMIEWRMRFVVIPCLVLSVWITGVVALSAQTPQASRTDPLYLIQASDVLQIFVWKEPTLSAKVIVRPDGRISLPLVQDLQAANLNPGQLKEQIEEHLKQYIDVPNVTVIVESIQSYRVFVTGKVSKPGIIATDSPISVLQALALAGGFVDFANPGDTVVIRNNMLFRFNYPDVIQGKNFSQNMLLKSGDVVVVP